MRGMRSSSAVNQPMGGGPKKSGLAASNLGSAGVGLLHGRTYMGGPRGVQANYRNKDLVFHYKSYIGGIGHSVGGRSLGRMMDGVRSFIVKPKLDSCPAHYRIQCSEVSSEDNCESYYMGPMQIDGEEYGIPCIKQDGNSTCWGGMYLCPLGAPT